MSHPRFEYRSDVTTGYRWDEDAKDWLTYTALRLRWRAKGSRHQWKKRTLIPQNGQTIEGLRAKLPEIIDALSAQAASTTDDCEAVVSEKKP